MKKCLSVAIILALMVSLLCPGLSVAESGMCGQNVTWTVQEDRSLVIAGNGPMKDYDWNGSPWSHRSDIPSVRIIEGVTSVGAFAFYCCEGLTSFTLPSTVTSIGECAFYVSNLKSATIPAGVKTIGKWAFSGNNNLTAIEVAEGNQFFSSVDGVLYDKSGTVLLSCPAGKQTLTIPDGVTSIGDGACQACHALTSVTFPSGVTSIGSMAFSNCSKLTEVILPEGLTRIPESCFDNSNNLSSIYIPASVTEIGYSAFDRCGSLSTVNYAGTLAQWAAMDIQEDGNADLLFQHIHCKDGDTTPRTVSGHIGLNEEITYTLTPEGLLTISGAGKWDINAFYSNSHVVTVRLSSGVTEIGDSAFEYCRNLQAITVPDTVTTIHDFAFRGCDNLQELSIPASVTSLGSYVFDDCSTLYDIHFGGTMAAWQALVENTENTGLNNITVSCSDGIINEPEAETGTCGVNKALTWSLLKGVLTISGEGEMDYYDFDYTFDDKITKVIYGPGVQKITPCFTESRRMVSFEVDPSNPYYTSVNGVVYTRDMKNLIECPTKKTGSLTIPEGVEKICFNAFMSSSLSRVNLPSTLTAIEYQAFFDSKNLTEITLPALFSGFEASTFSGCSNLAAIHVAEGNATYKSVNGILYSRDGSEILRVPEAYSGTLTLSGVVRVGWAAFGGCARLTAITFGEGLLSFEGYAFDGCGVKTVSLPASLTSIGDMTFSGMNFLETIYFAGTRSQWAAIEKGKSNGALLACEIHCSDGDPTQETLTGSIGDDITYTLTPEGVLTVSGAGEWFGYAFERVNRIRKVVLESGVTEIGSYAFRNCENLTEITIPDTVRQICPCAFVNCSSLLSIEIPTTVRTIDDSAFEGCDNLVICGNGRSVAHTYAKKHGIPFRRIGPVTSSIMSTNGSLYWTLDEDGLLTFEPKNGCSIIFGSNTTGYAWTEWADEIITVIVPEGITEIQHYAFNSCKNMTSLTLPEGLIAIGERAFRNCLSLPEVVIPDTVTSLGQYAFYNCRALESVHLSAGVSVLESNVFFNCDALTEIAFPEGVTSIGYFAFGSCNALTSVTFPASLTTLGDYAFDGCNKLTAAPIPENVTSIGRYAFRDCKTLTEISLPDGVTVIRDGAFQSCTALTSFTFPENLTQICQSAFSGCGNLTELTFRGSVDTIERNAFEKCGFITLTLPEGLTSIKEYAFQSCPSLTHVSLPSTLTSLGNYIFKDCPALVEIYFADTKQAWNSVSRGFYSVPSGVPLRFWELHMLTLPADLTSIESEAFANLTGDFGIVIPQTVTNIAVDAFSGTKVIIYAPAGSYAASWAEEHQVAWREQQ